VLMMSHPSIARSLLKLLSPPMHPSFVVHSCEWGARVYDLTIHVSRIVSDML